MRSFIYLTLAGLLPSHYSTTPALHCSTTLKPVFSCGQARRLAEPDLRHGFLTEYGAANTTVPNLNYKVTASQSAAVIDPTQRHYLAITRDRGHRRFHGGEYHWRDHFSSLDSDANSREP